jgi:hypothetical protein
MNRVLYIVSIVLLLFECCSKDKLIKKEEEDDTLSLPFDSALIKIDLVTNSAPGNSRDIHFFNSLKGIAVTFYGSIYLTIDGGITWDLKYEAQAEDQPLYQYYL